MTQKNVTLCKDVPKRFPKTNFIFKSFKNPLNKVTMFLNVSLSLDSFQIIPHVFILYLTHYYVNTLKKVLPLELWLPPPQLINRSDINMKE